MTVKPITERARPLRLTHTKCGQYVDVTTRPNTPEDWPLHKCSKTHKAEHFDWWGEVPKLPVAQLPPEELPRLVTRMVG